MIEFSAEKLACDRAGHRVFAGLAFELRAGEIAHLRGPNGSGKSSLLAVLAGLLPAAAGNVRIDGQPAGAGMLTAAAAYAGHQDGLKPALTLQENLVGWLRILGAEETGGEAALARMGIAARAGTPARFCSAGERRRAALARVFATGRPVWLLDEPAASLDADGIKRLSAALAGHAASGGLAVVATHQPLTPTPAVTVELAAGTFRDPDSA